MNLSKLVVMSLAVVMILPAWGQLATLHEKSMIGQFASYRRRDFHFCVKVDGKMVLWPHESRREGVSFYKTINVSAEVTQEANGKVQSRQIMPVTLRSSDAPTTEPTKTKFSGKVTGDAEFEVMLEYVGDQISIGGRLLHPGKLVDPTFQIRVKFGDLYRFQSDDDLKREAKRDRIEVVRIDDKKAKVGVLENMDLSADAVTGIGLKRVEVDLPPYEGRAFVFETKGEGKMVLENPRRMASPAKDGFSVIWRGDASKDSEGVGRMVITVK